VDTSKQQRYYTPWQVCVGTLLGGPLAFLVRHRGSNPAFERGPSASPLEHVMLRRTTSAQLKFLRKRFKELLAATPLPFSSLTPSKVPIASGVYVITAKLGNMEFPYYVGRTKNLRRRLYNNHLMGPATNARLKKHLVAGGECADMKSAKQFLKDTCSVRWILQDGHRERGAVEGYATGLLFPKYGIYEEH
jgi:hypothetical protein